VFWQVIKQAFNPAGSKKANHIVIVCSKYLFYIRTPCTVHKPEYIFAAIRFQPVHYFIILLIFRTYIQEFFIAFMFVDDIKHAFVGTISAIKDLAFAVQDKFLKIQGNSLSDTEVFGILVNIDLHFFADAEKMIDRITAG